MSKNVPAALVDKQTGSWLISKLLISKLDRPIDVKREEQQELENYSYPIEMFVTLTVTRLPSVVLGGHHGSGVWKLWI